MTIELSAGEEIPPLEFDATIPYPTGEPRAELWHYTNQSGLMGIVESKQLWATGLPFLNDSQEFIHARAIALEELDARMREESGDLRKYIEIIRVNVEASVPDPRVSVFSFSGVPDDLGQWRGYGTSSGAYALVFNGPELKSRLPLIPLVRCEYRLAQQREIIRGWIANVVAIAKRRIPHGEAALKDGMQYLLLVELFSRMAPALKNEAFDAEHEWRMIAHPRMPGVSESVRGTASGLRPTIKIQLDEHMSACLRRVVVGPMPDQKREMLAVERLLSLHGLSSVPVRPSAVPFRTW